MCVIALCTKNRPTPEMVAKMYAQNDHGGGLAWRDVDDKKAPIVRWKKGLDLDEMQDFIKRLPLPFVAHFRIASSGGKSEYLCHPFPVSKSAELETEGTTKGFVLFHNGDWSEWRGFTKDTALKMGRPLPIGRWSDTRALAWACYNYGPGILEMIDQKVVIFGPKPTDLEVCRGNGWDEVNGVWCSNKFWEHQTYRANDYRRNQRQEAEVHTPPFPGRTDPHAKDDYWKHGRKDIKTPISQGGETFEDLPFDLVEEIWKDQQEKPRSEWKLSKKQFKRLRAKAERATRKQLKRAKKQRPSTPPPASTASSDQKQLSAGVSPAPGTMETVH